jgi:hypothetical protein
MEYPPGWDCQKATVKFELYFTDQLSLVEALALAEHLEACPECPQQLVLFRMTAISSRRG